MMIKGVLFDFDGVVVKSMEDHYKGWRKVFEKYGIQLQKHDLYLLEGQGVRSVAEQMAQKYDLPLKELDTIIQEKKIIYEKIKKLEIYDGLLNVLQYLYSKKISLGIVTGGDKKRVLETLAHFQIDHYFETIVTADDVTHTKPHPEPFEKGVKMFKLSPAEVMVVENAPLGIKSAKSAGCWCTAITNTLSKEYLQEADFIINKYEELIPILEKDIK